MTLVTPEPTIARDRWSRPLVIPPAGGKPTAYTRCTTYVGVLEDTYNLQRWMQRQVALGLAKRPDLLLSVSAHPDDKRELDRICEAAREASASSAAATTGTALHALTELVDRGQELPPLPPGPKASLEAYVEATRELTAVHIEAFTVQDRLKVGGTPDRIVRLPDGRLVVADLKTGASVEYGALKIAQQIAVYAHSDLYDVTTGARSHHGADTTQGLIIHCPATDDPAQARCELIWVDLVAGWDAVRVAGLVRDQRAVKFADLTQPYVPGQAPASRGEQIAASKTNRGVQVLTPGAATPTSTSLEEQLAAATSREELLVIWQANEAVWSDELTATAQRRLAVLEQDRAAS